MITVKDKDTLDTMVNSKTNKSFYVGDDFLKDVRKMLNEMDESSEQSSNMPSIKRTFNGYTVTIGITPEELEALNEQAELFKQKATKSSIFTLVGDNAYIDMHSYIADAGDVCDKIASALNDLHNKSGDYKNIDVFLPNMSDIQKQLEHLYPVFSKDASGYKLTGNVYNSQTKSITPVAQADRYIASKCDFRCIYEDYEGVLHDGNAKFPTIGLKEIFENQYLSFVDEREFDQTHDHVFASDQSQDQNQNKNKTSQLFYRLDIGDDLFISDYCIADADDVCNDVASYLEEAKGFRNCAVNIPWAWANVLECAFPIFHLENRELVLTGDFYDTDTRKVQSIESLEKEIVKKCEFLCTYLDQAGELQEHKVHVPDIDLKKIFIDSTKQTIKERLAKEQESDKEEIADDMELE